MNARSIRIAILVFVVGASLLNLVALLQAHRDIGHMAPYVAAAPCANQDLFAPPCTPDPKATPTPPPDTRIYYSTDQLSEHSRANSRAAEYEIVILTISGVAWFLVPKRASSPS